MGKRGSRNTDGDAAFRKRQKIVHEIPAGEDVVSVDQLRKLLSFDQDLQRARHGLQSFKKLLDESLSDNGDRTSKLAILRQYLEGVRPRDVGEETVWLPDIMEMWSFALQVNNDGVMSSVAVVLSLLLRIISDSLELVPHGLGICQTLLQDRQLKSIARNLSSEKNKGFVISPTLRLLREAVCLDGGAYAKRVVRARQSTFASLGRNLEIGPVGDAPEDVRKSSVRTNAVRFFLSCLKFLHADGKKELLLQKELLSHLTFMIKTDPPYIVTEILDALKTHVLMDEKIPREIKFRGFNTKTLMRFLALYTYNESAESSSDSVPVSEKAHQFLTFVCTNPVAGILYPSTGLYPKESGDAPISRISKAVTGAETHLWDGKFTDGIPVFNFVLSEFARKLRPWSSIKHSELLVSIFTAAPELIADYFLNNRSFTFEPKLSMTWIGYAAFLFNTMMIPVPQSFGDRVRYAKMPPPTSILLDNLLPLPINQKVLVRCLSPKSHLTSFFAARILVLALEKLTVALKMLDATDKAGNPTWAEASRRVLDAFCQRIPDMKEIVRCYKSIPPENALQKSITSRLLRLYYEVIPRVALAANFDVSPCFVDVLNSLDEESTGADIRALRIMELENLVSIASYSPGMRWFARVELGSNRASSSPFSALLKLLCASDQSTPLGQLRKVLGEVAAENQLISCSSDLRPLLQVLRHISTEGGEAKMEPAWSFLDNCINRCASSPIKYLDLLEGYLKGGVESSSSSSPSLLAVTMVEQLDYATASMKNDQKAVLARFLSLYFSALSQASEKRVFVESTYEKVRKHFAAASVELPALEDIMESFDEDEADYHNSEVTSTEASTDRAHMDESSLEELLHTPFLDEEDASSLTKWVSKNVEDLVEDGWTAKVIRLLSSQHTYVRKEALTNLLKMAAKIKESNYEEKEQVWLLLSELAESSRARVDTGPAPSTFTAFSIHALEILRNPLHPLYPKINTYLTRSPVWPLEKLPLAHDILHGEPSEDDKYYTEITWLLTYLLDSLRTPFDLGVLHKKRWFEKILVLGSNPYLRFNLRSRILRIVYRATCIDAGSTTLITRFGIMTWLDVQRAGSDVKEETVVYEALMRRVWDTCDQERVRQWSKGGVEKLLENI
ncbi:ribosome 60S biogenesis N-terminal-domain-containing protein [Stachybotrys elegans]|uniref:Ribosome 60S biogenesis N-terminal-domain-containing protein n=1 Tax=Stachybotrys elegans TaxID=80388 RepID=A0A8K0WVS5_9HYPO|nr:ribosome 60S biogenesis N-terminal-domain-containing protein [Stachybotrys elegans]